MGPPGEKPYIPAQVFADMKGTKGEAGPRGYEGFTGPRGVQSFSVTMSFWFLPLLKLGIF